MDLSRLQTVRCVAGVVNAVAMPSLLDCLFGRAEPLAKTDADSPLASIADRTFGVVVACL